MTDRRISEHTANTSIADGDLFEHVDISDTTDAATGTNKKVTAANVSVYIDGKLVPYKVGGTDVAVTDGGTGASDAATARTNLGLGSISTQASSNVTITGGSISGITDLAVADGGTGASTAAAALSNLGGIASSLVDAKGDLITATADNTPAILTVGTDGYVLTADSAQSKGIKWAAASGGGVTFTSPALSGQYYPTSFAPIGAPFASATTANQIWYWPWTVEGSCTLDELWVEVTTNVSGKSIMMAVYAADSTWHPTTLVGGGSVSATTTGMKKVTGINTAMAAGRYLLALNCDSSSINVRAAPCSSMGWASTSDFATASRLNHFHATETFTSTPNSTPTDWTTISASDAFYMYCFPLTK